MYKLIKLLMVSALAIVPYTGIEASVASDHSTVNFNDNDHVAVRVRSGAKVKASPIRAHGRRDARRDDRQDYTEEQYSEPTEEQYSEPVEQQQRDRGRPGGRR